MSLNKDGIESEPLPAAKTDRLVVQEFEDETLVYDLETNSAHCLNRTAALVWRACTGSRKPEQIAEILSAGSEPGFTGDLVRLALAQLSDRKLVTGFKAEESKGISRRNLIKKVGLASSAALPLIASIAVPTNALAQSSICGAPSPCGCNGRGTNGGSCASASCASGCTCRNLRGCNPAGNHCTGTCEA